MALGIRLLYTTDNTILQTYKTVKQYPISKETGESERNSLSRVSLGTTLKELLFVMPSEALRLNVSEN